jgi:hypothetical protein
VTSSTKGGSVKEPDIIFTVNSQPPMAPRRWAALSKELDAAASLLAHGVRILQIDGYSVLDAPAVLACLATGVEKLLKLTVGMVAIEETGTWPDKKTMAERYRHAILDLDRNARAAIANRIGEGTAPGYIRQLLDSVDNDAVVAVVLQTLDSYARKGRFYNLDMLADEPQPDPSPSELWHDGVETKILLADVSLLEQVADPEKYAAGRQRLNGKIVASIEGWWELYYRAWVTGVVGSWAKVWASQLDPKWHPITRRNA